MNLASDLTTAVRNFEKHPGFFTAAVFAIALGIGVNSAMFSVIDAVLLRPLPFPQSDSLVNVWESSAKFTNAKVVVAPGNYYDWRAQNHVFSAMGAFQSMTFTLARQEEPERFIGAICDPGFFQTLGVVPERGRIFTEKETELGSDGAVILSHGLWLRKFGGDPGIVGRPLTFDNKVRTVVGIMPAGFEYPAKAELWTPLGFDNETRERRDFHRLQVIARLKDGVSLEQAQTAYAQIGSTLAKQYPDFNKDETILVNPTLEDAVSTLRPALLVLSGAVIFVLLIACANVANLQLAKALGRQRETAIRASLGAGRGALIRQSLTESLLLSLLGAGAGLMLASLGVRALVAAAPPNLIRLQQVAVDWRAVVFTLGLSVFTGLLFGLLPAWQGSRTDVTSMLKEGGRGISPQSGVRNQLVVIQVASAVVLLVGTGLLLRTFYNLAHLDPGFDPEHVLTMRLVPAAAKYKEKPELQRQLAENILREVAAVPGVKQVATSSDIPLLGNPIYIMRFEGRPPVTPAQAPLANYFAVTPGFFDTMRMRIIRGRPLTEQDHAGAPLAVVVNQALVNKFFPNENPIGKRLELAFADPPEWREIVGVVADVRSTGLDQQSPVQVYASYLQRPEMVPGLVSAICVLARTQQDPALLAEAVHQAVLRADRSQPVYAIQPMTTVVAQSLAQRRFAILLLTIFAVAAVFLAALGLYGVVSYTVAQRTSEIGIRMALGAQRRRVLWQIETEALRLVGSGVLIGVAGALILGRLLTSLLYDVDPNDASTYAAVGVVLLVVALGAAYLPARRAAEVNPLQALRHE